MNPSSEIVQPGGRGRETTRSKFVALAGTGWKHGARHRKAAFWLLLGALVIWVGWTRWAGPLLAERSIRQLQTGRRQVVYYRHFPAFEMFWRESMHCLAEFSVHRIFAGYETNKASLDGLLWSEGKAKLIGSFSAQYKFPEGSTQPSSLVFRLRMDRSEVAAMLNDPLHPSAAPYRPSLRPARPYSGGESPQSPPAYVQLPRPIQHLGPEIQSQLRSMDGVGGRSLSLWGFEGFLFLDKQCNLELTLRTRVPNPYVATLVQKDQAKDATFYMDVVPKVARLLRKATFKGNVDISYVTSENGATAFGGSGHGYVRIIVLTPSGQPYRVSVLEQTRNEIEMSISPAGVYRRRDDLLERDLSPAFLNYIKRKELGLDARVIGYTLPAQFFLSLDEDIPKIIAAGEAAQAQNQRPSQR